MDDLECCPDEPPGAALAAPGVAGIKQSFRHFMAAVNQPVALDAATKEAVNLALSIATRCGPCTRTHLRKARDMGFTDEEIDELAMMAIAFGGSPVMMFYNEARRSS